MPYDIRKFPEGYKVCKKGTKKCYSNDPIPLKRAVAQRKAIAISEHSTGGAKLEGCGFFDDEDWTGIVKKPESDYTRDKIIGGANQITMTLPSFNKEHNKLVGLLEQTGQKLINEAKDQAKEQKGWNRKLKGGVCPKTGKRPCECIAGGDIDWSALANIGYDYLIKPHQKDQGQKLNKRKEGDDERNWGYDEEEEVAPPPPNQPLFGDPTQFKPQPYDPNNPLMYMGGSMPINKKLYEKAKEMVYPLYKKPSAYRSGAVIKKYKELGGKFRERGERKLKRWFAEDWKDIGNKSYPVYRPSRRITKDTPLTPDEIDPKNLKQQIALKQQIKGDKNLPKFEGGDIDWWGIGKDLLHSGSDFISKLVETPEQKEAREKKEEACKLCNEGKEGSGKLYAKDKYATGEKELTPTEKKLVKSEMGEGNPEIAEIAKDPMGDDDIRKYFPNAKILKYSELSKYSDITQLLPRPKTFFFLLYERSPNVGHWTLVSRYIDNGKDTIEFFCSYGSKIDAPLSWTPIGIRVQLGEDKPFLSILLDKSPFRVIYNPVQYQSKKSNISTCGAYDTLRAGELVKHNTTLDEFNDMLREVKKATGLNYDEIVSNLVHMR
jgi:hypothetical protein